MVVITGIASPLLRIGLFTLPICEVEVKISPVLPSCVPGDATGAQFADHSAVAGRGV